MSASIVDAVARVKESVAKFVTAASIVQVCHEVKHRWRERELGPAETVWAFLLQVLYGNTSCNHVVRLAKLTCSGAAYCGARARLPLAVFQRIVEQTCQAARCGHYEPRWHGHRTFFADGTSFSMPDTPELQEYFGQPGQQQRGCGFPIAHVLAMFDAATGLLIKALIGPLRTHDMSQTAHLHPELSDGDLLVADRGFSSYTHLALLLRQKLHGLFRVHQRQLVSFRRDRRLDGKQPRGTVAKFATSRLIRKLGRFDQVVEYVKPVVCPEWLDEETFAALPQTIQVRELRYHVSTPGFRVRAITLVTTLLDAEVYLPEELAEVYRRRWEIETNFGHLKTTMGMDVLRCQRVDGVLKELTMFVLVYNLVRTVMLAAARIHSTPLAQISFIDALRWLIEACDHDAPLLLRINPMRRNRIEPRVRKRRPKEYPLMNQPRRKLRQQLIAKSVTP